ncbi:LLM class flavin-dependent oxidoreductase [Amycolatopsis sp.]|uniref:LLM class flavin-dependent oxidoreductase n=1 Tax=Amycolatopsis sp. TaxID=37632 RepID=UPI002CD9ECEF|nr:LLM class flavin-dependent oxidoreductase [Amycolatopsis sp.]HVV11886.1 LLM class flavin-dependent oxidoreductase [Amycolatopsis sp.]
MHFGILLLFANAGSALSDDELWKAEMDLGEHVEELGYDSVWVPEHHFDRPYCESPDPLQALTYLAARTSRIQLGTGAIILPWHRDPLRLAERISILDSLSDGRLQLGVGRGLARVEYEGFKVDLDDSRERFSEAAQMLIDGLDSGVIEHEGKHFSQPRREIFPKPSRSFRDRLFTIAMSPESTVAMAEIGGGLMCFNYQYPIEQQAAQFDTWRARYREVQGTEPPPPTLLDFAYCHSDPEVADSHMRHYLSRFYSAMVDHYEFDGKHFGNTSTYSSYQSGADMLREYGREAGFEAFYGLQLKGSPEQMVETLLERRRLCGEYRQMLLVSFGGMDYKDVKESLRLISEEVIPEVNRRSAELAASPATV